MKAQQAKLNNNYKNTRLKLLKTKATIRFSKSICWLIIKVCLQYFVQNNKKKMVSVKVHFILQPTVTAPKGRTLLPLLFT